MSTHTIAMKITVVPQGGTIDILERELPSAGYFVGGAGAALIFPSGLSVDVPLIKAFMSRMSARYVGWWTDRETGKVYVDEVSWFGNHDKAAETARERGELAFWDIAEKRELRLT